MVRHRHATLRLHRAGHLARRAGGADVGVFRRTKRYIKQTPWLWRLAENVRSRLGSVSLSALRRAFFAKVCADVAKPHKSAGPKRDRASP